MSEKSQYKSLTEWRKTKPKYYTKAHREGWLDDICEKFGWAYKKIESKPKGYWTKEKCINEARKHKTKADWVRASKGSQHSAIVNGWYDECTTHMEKRNRWTKELCIQDAKKYKTRKEWRKLGSYGAAKRNGWLDECSKHMIELNKPNGFWTKENCIAEAKKYKGSRDWNKLGGGSYYTARKNGWLKECKSYLNNDRKISI